MSKRTKATDDLTTKLEQIAIKNIPGLETLDVRGGQPC